MRTGIHFARKRYASNDGLRWHPARLFDDREAHAGLVAVVFRNRAPGIFGFLAGLERTLHLGRTFDQLVEVHRTELAANHPEIAAHDRSPSASCLAELVHGVVGTAG